MDSAGRSLVTLVAAASLALAPQWAHAQALEPIAYVVRIPAPDTHMIEVLATSPTSGRRSIDLMMPVWSPGYYRVEDYAANVRELKATNEYLASLSSLIGDLQNAAGRLLQSVE